MLKTVTITWQEINVARYIVTYLVCKGDLLLIGSCLDLRTGERYHSLSLVQHLNAIDIHSPHSHWWEVGLWSPEMQQRWNYLVPALSHSMEWSEFPHCAHNRTAGWKPKGKEDVGNFQEKGWARRCPHTTTSSLAILRSSERSAFVPTTAFRATGETRWASFNIWFRPLNVCWIERNRISLLPPPLLPHSMHKKLCCIPH